MVITQKSIVIQSAQKCLEFKNPNYECSPVCIEPTRSFYTSQGSSILVALPRNVTPYRDSVDGTRDRVQYEDTSSLTSLHYDCWLNLLKPNDIYICRTAALTSRRYILNIYSTNIHTEYFKHDA